jgi:hypothetical protein
MDQPMLKRAEALFTKFASEPAPAQCGDTLTMSELDALMSKQREWADGQVEEAEAHEEI